MSTDVAASRARCERLMAEALRPVAAELRLVELDELIFHVKSGRCAEMADIVASCAELHFRPGALEFALAADARGKVGRVLEAGLVPAPGHELAQLRQDGRECTAELPVAAEEQELHA